MPGGSTCFGVKCGKFQNIEEMSLSLGISTSEQFRIAHICTKIVGFKIDSIGNKSFSVSVHLENLSLNKGNYRVTTFLDDENGIIVDWVSDAFVFTINVIGVTL